jgi:hypothetical protein
MTGPWVAESILELELELEWTTSFPCTGRWPVCDVRMWLIHAQTSGLIEVT